MTNIDRLNDILEGNDIALELLEKIESEMENLQEQLDGAEDEIKDLEREVDNLKDESISEDDLESIDLGLDTINFYFEKGNLQIRQQFDSLMEVLNKTPNAIIH